MDHLGDGEVEVSGVEVDGAAVEAGDVLGEFVVVLVDAEVVGGTVLVRVEG